MGEHDYGFNPPFIEAVSRNPVTSNRLTHSGNAARQTKAGNDQLHRDIENALDLSGHDFSLRKYQRLVRRFYGFYSPWEAEVSTIAPDLIAGRAKRSRLLRDLAYLGVGPDELSRIELCGSLPPLDTRVRVIGSMYVLEGATLGGQILSRHMRSRFGFESGGRHFFAGYGERTGSMWKQFGEILQAQPAHAHDEIVSSAVATFESIGLWVGAEPVEGARE